MIPKFRTWHKKEKVFLHEDMLEYPEQCPVKPNGNTFELDDRGQVVLEQSTGLKDKNSKEIFEGDIVLIECDPVEKTTKWVVKKHEKRPTFYYVAHREVEIYKTHKDKVIGNIHENPELLKKST